MSAAETAGAQVVALTINGQEVQGRAGQTILEVAAGAGIEIPTLCHDPRLEPYGACRMCLVEVEGARGPMAACGTAVKDGMKVQTHSDKILKIRKFVLELLLSNHPLDCPVCEAAGDCRLQDYAYEYLVDMVPWGWRGPVVGQAGDHPNIAHFGARCILCGRCVRICREVMSVGCWGYLNRGYDSEVDTPYRLPLADVECVSCGQCVSTCPVGAIVGQRTPQGARQWQTTKTVSTCGYCADGCRVVLHSHRDKVVKVTSEVGKGLNGGNLCVKGRFGWGYADSPDRVTKPLVRNAHGELEQTTWESAVALIKDKIVAAREAKGGSAVGAICGTYATNEAAYLLQKLMRAVVGSNNIDAIDGLEQAAAQALEIGMGLGAATGCREDLSLSDVILVVGANLTESHPVFALEVIKALRSGKTVIVVDPRRTELAGKATMHLRVKPGTDLAALRAMLRRVLDAGLVDRDAVTKGATGVADLEESLAKVDVAAEAAACGVDETLLGAAAEAFGRAAAATIVFGTGVVRGADAAGTVSALVDLAVLTGNVGRPGTGIFPLRSGANSQGLVDLGVRPDRLPGGAAADDEAATARLEAAWGAPLKDLAPGMGVAQMCSAADAGGLSVLYVMGADPALAVPGESGTRAALEKAAFVVVQDGFVSDTADYADVVLPAAITLEDEGTFTNGERVVQRVRAAVPAAGESLPDWKIVHLLAEALGADWGYAAPADIMREIAEVVPAYKGISYDRLCDEGLQWPCTEIDGGGTPRMGVTAARAMLTAIAASSVEASAPGDLPLLLVTGSVRTHHGTGVRSRRSPGSTNLIADAALEVAPADATAAGLADGDRVRVVNGAGDSVETTARVTSRVPQGVVFMPGFSATAPVTRLFAAGGGEAAPAVKIEKAG